MTQNTKLSSPDKPPRAPHSHLVLITFILGTCAVFGLQTKLSSSFASATSSQTNTQTTPTRLNSSNKTKKTDSKADTSTKDYKALCSNTNEGSLRGAFRELSCLISLRRNRRQDNHRLDRVVRKRFRALYRRLQSAPPNWKSVQGWKALYKLGTRMYPLQNRWAAEADIPVYEVNGHHKSFPFWLKESRKRKVGPLFHLDSHADMRSIPDHKQVVDAVHKLRHDRDIKQAWHTIAHAVNDCAMPVSAAVLSGAYRHVIWGVPPWIPATKLLNRTFFFAVPNTPQLQENNQFLPRWQPLPERPSPRHSRYSHDTPRHANPPKPPPHVATSDAWSTKHNNTKPPKTPKVFQLYYDPLQDKQQGKTPLKKDPLWHTISAKRRPHKRHFSTIRPLRMSVLRTTLHIDTQGKGKDAPLAKKLLKALPRGPFTLDLDLDYFASIDSSRHFSRRPGMSPFPWNPGIFRKQRRILKQRLQRFQTLLRFLKKHGRVPALITIADSTFLEFAFDKVAEGQSEYTPLEHAAFLRREVRALIRRVYGRKVIGSTQNTSP